MNKEEEAKLRDHFASQALMGIMSSLPHRNDSWFSYAAKWAYEVADKMMEQRGKGE